MKLHSVPVVPLKSFPDITEAKIQNSIADDPAIIGLGPLVYIGRERAQTGGGRLDLLLSDEDDELRFTVEIQLGRTDPSHIIRTIEYWDLERRQNPGIDHIAVIVAEEVTKRFYNVISLLSESVPLIALQVAAIKTDQGIGLIFTKVHDTAELYFGSSEDNTPELATDRSYWEKKRGSTETIEMADAILDLIHRFSPNASLNYNKHYIGVQIDGVSKNFVTLRAQRKLLRFDPKIPHSVELDEKIEDLGLLTLPYDKKHSAYRMKLRRQDLASHEQLLLELLETAFNLREGEGNGSVNFA